MSRSSYNVSFFYGNKRCYVRNLSTRKTGPLPHYYCHFYEKMKWLDARKTPKCSSQAEVKIENTPWRLAGLKGQQLTGYYHPVKGYKSILVMTANSSFFQVQLCSKMRICNLFLLPSSFKALVIIIWQSQGDFFFFFFDAVCGFLDLRYNYSLSTA